MKISKNNHLSALRSLFGSRNRRTSTGGVPPVDDSVYVLFLGDSIFEGSNGFTGPGPTPTPGTVRQWDGAGFIDVGSTDVLTCPAGMGTPLPNFGILLNASSGKVVNLNPRGVGGSAFSPATGFTNWSSAGTLYAPMVLDTNAMLSAAGVASLDAICINLGINDITGNGVLATIQTNIDSLFSRLIADFGDVPILVIMATLL